MKKILLIGLVIGIAIITIFSITGNKSKIDEQMVLQDTMKISRNYTALRLKTDKILVKASEYPDYETWKNDMIKLIDRWKTLESEAIDLENSAKIYSEEKIVFRLIQETHAYSKHEISNVFDKAPAGRKIRTLAKFLGVDAKRAFKILENEQDFIKAEAWNKAGDTFEKLENSAIVVKNGCKVAVFVGSVVATGGATAIGAGAVSSAASATVATVVGADLILEVTADTATIALGNNNKTTKYISKIRDESHLEPAAAILSLTDIPGNLKKGAEVAQKIGVLVMEAEQIRSIIQDKKVLGINIDPDSKKIEASGLNEDEIDDWEKEFIDSELHEKNMEEWMDELEKELEALDKEIEEVVEEVVEKFENEEKRKEKARQIIDRYITEMNGQPMDKLKILMGYAEKFTKMYKSGVLAELEIDELMVEARRLSDLKKKEIRDKKN